MRTWTKLLIGASSAIAFYGLFPAQAADLSSQDRKFIEEAAKGGMMEVHMGHMAVEHGMSAAVKSFGQRMVTDHGKANDELTALAKKKGITLPPDDPKMAESSSLAKKNGADFDRAYAKDMVEDHQKDISEFEKEASSGSDPDVKSWASKTLPTLRSHLTEAKALPGK
jgi:putative membrane protein